MRILLALLIASMPVLPVRGGELETLGQAWAQALAVDHGLKAVEAGARAAESRLQAARGERLPKVEVGVSYQTLNNRPEADAGFTTFPVGEKESHAYQFNATLPLFTSGRISSGIRAAAARYRAGQSQIAVQRLNLKLAVARAYVGVLRARRQLEVAESHVKSLAAHLRDVRNLYDQGMVSRNDLLASEVALADARQGAIRRRNGLDVAEAAFNRLLGRSLNAPVAIEDVTPEPLTETLADYGRLALRQRPELQALARQAESLRHQARAVRAAVGPQVAVNGGYKFQENQNQVHEGNWSVGVGLNWRVFDGGVAWRQAQAVAHEAQRLEEQRDDLASRILLEVRQQWLEVQEALQRIEVTARAIEQAEENLRVNRDRYQNGLSTNTEVLDAETLRQQALSNHADAAYDAVLAILRLKKAAGVL